MNASASPNERPQLDQVALARVKLAMARGDRLVLVIRRQKGRYRVYSGERLMAVALDGEAAEVSRDPP